MAQTQRNKKRAPENTTITFPISRDKKKDLLDRARRTPANLTISDLCRLAIDFQIARDWKDIPEARTTFV